MFIFFLVIYYKTQKATKTIATASFPTTTNGISQPTSGLVAGDRGCLPTPGAAFIAQKTTQQLTLANGADFTAFATDYGSLTYLLCSTSGVCCTTDLCNTMSRIEMSFVAMFVSIALALIGVLNGF